MERAANFNVLSLFSRGATPPQDGASPAHPPSQQSPQFQQQQPQHVSPAQSYREPPSSTSPKSIDSLFRNINSNAQGSSEVTPSATGNNPFRSAPAQPQNHSPPGTPMSSMTAASASSGASGGNDRQSALLSLLGSTVAPSGNTPANQPALPGSSSSQQFAPQQQSSTPPNGDQRTRQTGNEAQGKFLLEQLMAGNIGSTSTFSDPPQSQSQSQSSYSSTNYPPQVYGPLPQDALRSREALYIPSQPEAPLLQPAPAQQQPPSPSRKSMFDFVSPFDALAATSSAKKRVDPAVLMTSDDSHDSTEDSSWTAISDPKRKSVENLMDQLTRSQVQYAPPQHQYDPYNPDSGTTPPPEPAQMQPRGPLANVPLKPSQATSSPRASPPRGLPQRLQGRSGESPVHQPSGSGAVQTVTGPGMRDAGSPTRGAWKTGGQEQKRAVVPKTKLVMPPSPHMQSIIFDVSQNLESIQATRDCVRSTAIALVKVESQFLHGTTIGATHWVAYAMTRGRVRVISRSSGDRTLLQLPNVFGATISVTDMAVYGNRLAGVTSDGGFVVWELPEVITDDVPGKLLVCIIPSNDFDPLHAVKWNPKDPDTLAVASDSNIYLLNVAEAANVYRNMTLTQADLPRASQIFPMSSPLVSFDFDGNHQALATISEDSVLTLWNIPEKMPFWQQQIAGDGTPSSLTLLEAGVVIGRKNGTVFQLLPIMGDVVLSTVTFVNGTKDDPDMFGHVTYDSRIQTLWVANNRRDGFIAFRVVFEMSTPSPGGDELIRGAYFEQVVEFVGPKPTINFVILTADADPTGEEANAACVAAKLPAGELALVAFAVHSSGVDQVLIRKEWYDSAFMSTTSKLPAYTPPTVPQPVPDTRQQRQGLQPVVSQPPQTISQPTPSAPIRLRSPASEEVEIEQSKDEARPHDVKGKGAKGKNVGWKDKDDSSGKEKEKEKSKAAAESSILSESPLGVALSKEIRKVEENLHTRIGRLIAKELDKQHQRLEEARVNEQAQDFVRQEKILKLISTELTKNTTRVVEAAVRSEVQNSVLPSLENITKTEVKMAVNNHLSKGLSDSMSKTLGPELEKMLIKPEVANQISRNLANAVSPFVERNVKDVITKTLIPAYQAQSSAMHQDLSREIRSEISNLKKEVIAWQTDALRGQESLIRDMDQTIRNLAEQLKFMSMNMPAIQHVQQSIQAQVGSAQSVQPFG